MICASSQDKEVKLIGEGGNWRIYLLQRDCDGVSFAAIKVPKAFANNRVSKALDNYKLLKRVCINTTSFLEECLFDGIRALITENLHHEDYTYLDANARLLTEIDSQLRMIGADCRLMRSEKEPEEERRFADNKFETITNLESFIDNHILLLRRISDERIYLAYDCYFFRVRCEKETDLDYMIADWDDVQICEDDDLFEKNKDQFKTALIQFVDKFVAEVVSEKYHNYIEQL